MRLLWALRKLGSHRAAGRIRCKVLSREGEMEGVREVRKVVF